MSDEVWIIDRQMLFWNQVSKDPYVASILGREEAPEHFFRRMAITSPDCQEFMV